LDSLQGVYEIKKISIKNKRDNILEMVFKTNNPKYCPFFVQ